MIRPQQSHRAPEMQHQDIVPRFPRPITKVHASKSSWGQAFYLFEKKEDSNNGLKLLQFRKFFEILSRK